MHFTRSLSPFWATPWKESPAETDPHFPSCENCTCCPVSVCCSEIHGAGSALVRLHHIAPVCCSVLQCVSLCSSVLQCGSCSTLQCVAVSTSGSLIHLLIHAQVAHISRCLLNSHSYRWRMCVWVYTWTALKTAQSSKNNSGVCGEIHITADKIWTIKDELKVNNELKIWFVLHDTSKYEISLAWWSMYKETNTFAYTPCTQMYLCPCTWIIMLEKVCTMAKSYCGAITSCHCANFGLPSYVPRKSLFCR